MVMNSHFWLLTYDKSYREKETMFLMNEVRSTIDRKNSYVTILNEKEKKACAK